MTNKKDLERIEYLRKLTARGSAAVPVKKKKNKKLSPQVQAQLESLRRSQQSFVEERIAALEEKKRKAFRYCELYYPPEIAFPWDPNFRWKQDRVYNQIRVKNSQIDAMNRKIVEKNEQDWEHYTKLSNTYYTGKQRQVYLRDCPLDTAIVRRNGSVIVLGEQLPEPFTEEYVDIPITLVNVAEKLRGDILNDQKPAFIEVGYGTARRIPIYIPPPEVQIKARTHFDWVQDSDHLKVSFNNVDYVVERYQDIFSKDYGKEDKSIVFLRVNYEEIRKVEMPSVYAQKIPLVLLPLEYQYEPEDDNI